MSEPTTRAGKALVERYLTTLDGYSPFRDDVAAIEDEARATARKAPVKCPRCGLTWDNESDLSHNGLCCLCADTEDGPGAVKARAALLAELRAKVKQLDTYSVETWISDELGSQMHVDLLTVDVEAVTALLEGRE